MSALTSLSPADKRLTLAEAATLVQPGQTLALGGNMLYRRPVAFVRELLRRPQPPVGLTLLCFTAGYESDLLVGAGCVSQTRTCYFGLEAFGLAPMFTAAANAGQLPVHASQLVEDAAFRRGLVIYPCTGSVDGLLGDMILMAPPLIITRGQVDDFMDILHASIAEVAAQLRGA